MGTKEPKEGRHRRRDARAGWYLQEWLERLDLKQTHLINATGWTKGRVSELVSGKQRFHEDHLRIFGAALGIPGRFLLWHPDEITAVLPAHSPLLARHESSSRQPAKRRKKA